MAVLFGTLEIITAKRGLKSSVANGDRGCACALWFLNHVTVTHLYKLRMQSSSEVIHAVLVEKALKGGTEDGVLL